MDLPIISVRNLKKSYRLYSSPSERLKEGLWPWKQRHTLFHALNDITFEIQRGEHLGIIGINGAGKSTLLKILTGVLSPTSGNVCVNGRVAALLELGAGYNPELTGRENVSFQLQIGSLSKSEINKAINDVENFADIGSYFDQPVKVYSSGMFVRVAFAQATVIKPDILIVDEAFSVGDARFQKKCYDKIEFLRSQGVTLLLVSHDIYVAKKLSSKLLMLHEGSVFAFGPPEEVAARYFSLLFPPSEDLCVADASTSISNDQDKIPCLDSSESLYRLAPLKTDISWGVGGALLKEIRINGLRSNTTMIGSQQICIECDYSLDNKFLVSLASKKSVKKNLLLGIRFDNQQGQTLTDFASSTFKDGILPVDIMQDRFCTFRFTIDLPELARGNYFLSPALALGTQQNFVPIFCYENLIMIYYEPINLVLGLFRAQLKIQRMK